MTWEQRYWAAFLAIIELEKNLENPGLGAGPLVLCNRCCKRSLEIIMRGVKAKQQKRDRSIAESMNDR